MPLDEAGTATVTVNVAKHAEILKERVAVWLVQTDEREAQE